METHGQREQLVRILNALRRAINLVDLFSRTTQATLGVSGPQLVSMTVLYNHGPITLNVLAEKAFTSSATLTGIVDRLERKAYVRRVRSQEDRRKIFVELTDAGRSLVEHAPHPLEMTLLEGLKRRTAEQNQQLCEDLEGLVRMLEAGAVEDQTESAAGPVTLGSESVVDGAAAVRSGSSVAPGPRS